MMEIENRMGTAPIQRLLLVNSIPLMLSLLFSTLYNTVDSMFIARINEEALTAVSLAASMQLLMDALGSGIALVFAIFPSVSFFLWAIWCSGFLTVV